MKIIAYTIGGLSTLGALLCATTFQWNYAIGLIASGCCFWLLGSITDQVEEIRQELVTRRREPPLALQSQLDDLKYAIERLARGINQEAAPSPPQPPPPRQATLPGGPWSCPRCGEKCEAQFTSCWQCKEPRPAA